jgi:hypothetical protein
LVSPAHYRSGRLFISALGGCPSLSSGFGALQRTWRWSSDDHAPLVPRPPPRLDRAGAHAARLPPQTSVAKKIFRRGAVQRDPRVAPAAACPADGAVEMLPGTEDIDSGSARRGHGPLTTSILRCSKPTRFGVKVRCRPPQDARSRLRHWHRRPRRVRGLRLRSDLRRRLWRR